MRFQIQCPVTGGFIEAKDGKEAKEVAERLAQHNPNMPIHVYSHLTVVRYDPEKQDNAN